MIAEILNGVGQGGNTSPSANMAACRPFVVPTLFQSAPFPVGFVLFRNPCAALFIQYSIFPGGFFEVSGGSALAKRATIT